MQLSNLGVIVHGDNFAREIVLEPKFILMESFKNKTTTRNVYSYIGFELYRFGFKYF